MTDRQKEMLRNRAFRDFLIDNPDINSRNVKSYELITSITNYRVMVSVSHYLLAVFLYSGEVHIYVPKERFKVYE